MNFALAMNKSISPLFPYKILLGSQSPRRAFLMKESGFECAIKTIDVDESYPSHLEDHEIAGFIAGKKAVAYREMLGESRLGLVADTIVSLNGKILEKPKDRSEAVKMLSSMSDTKHLVYTGVCIFDRDNIVEFTGKSEVYFLPLSAAEIDFYIDQYKPFDKAGSYGIQEWIGYTKIAKIHGSYSNIMGLPMELVYQALFDFIDK